jgi:hypothetical protein
MTNKKKLEEMIKKVLKENIELNKGDKVRKKLSNRVFTVKSIRKSGSIELTDGSIINKIEFDQNWIKSV